ALTGAGAAGGPPQTAAGAFPLNHRRGFWQGTRFVRRRGALYQLAPRRRGFRNPGARESPGAPSPPALGAGGVANSAGALPGGGEGRLACGADRASGCRALNGASNLRGTALKNMPPRLWGASPSLLVGRLQRHIDVIVRI